MQAMFKITVVVPSEVTALSNMPVVEERIDGNVKTLLWGVTRDVDLFGGFCSWLVCVIEDVSSNGQFIQFLEFLRSYQPMYQMSC